MTFLVTVSFWILNTWILDSKGVRYSNGKVTWLGRLIKHWTLDSKGVRYLNGKVMWLGRLIKHWTFWTINRLCQSSFWQLNTNLPFKYQTSLVFKWLLYTQLDGKLPSPCVDLKNNHLCKFTMLRRLNVDIGKVLSWYIRPKPEDRINRKPANWKNDWRTKNTKNWKTEKMNSTVLYQIFGPVYMSISTW